MHRTPPPAEGSFAATLPVLERRLAGRLEGFGDIVFGFAVSQCALELPTTHSRVDLSHPLALLFYFGTFTLLAMLWLTYHRLMSGTFRPTRIDLFLGFAYLALVSLMPYALYSISHEQQTIEDARAAVAAYSGLFALLMAIAATIGFRNLRRGWWSMDTDERQKSWIAIMRRCALLCAMTVGLIVDLAVGPAQASIPFFFIPLWIRLFVWLGKKPPSKLLRIESPESAPLTS
jgi:uncharacterized membrane protein